MLMDNEPGMRPRRETGSRLADTLHQNGVRKSIPQAGMRSERCAGKENGTASSGCVSRSGIRKVAL